MAGFLFQMALGLGSPGAISFADIFVCSIPGEASPKAGHGVPGNARLEIEQMLEDLGKKISPEALADYLGVNVKTVRQYYKELGGIRLGSRYVFFEKGIVYAVSKEWKMESPSEKEWQEERKDVQHEERSSGVGKQNASVRGGMGREDRHDLLD